MVDADGGGVERCSLALQRDVNVRAHAEEDALAAPAIVGRYGRRCGGSHRLHIRKRFEWRNEFCSVSWSARRRLGFR